MLVSVYIPTKNRSHLAIRAVSSVLKQSYSHIEVILVDDNSDDSEYAVLRRYCEGLEKVTLLRNSGAPGACGARNTAIHHARGIYVTGLDDDDEFLSNRISKFVDLAAEIDFPICSNYLEEDQKSNKKKLILSNEGFFQIDELLDRNLVGNQIFAKKDVYLAAGLFDEEQSCWQDYDLWIRMMRVSKRFWKTSNESYLIHVDTNRPRITNQQARAEGILRFLYKNKDHLTKRQINRHEIDYRYRVGTLVDVEFLFLSIFHGNVFKYGKAVAKLIMQKK